MIAKAFTLPRPTNPALATGWEAEKQMAFYLAREFEPAPDVLVFNGLRFPAPHAESAEDHFQIDHLVQYRHGAVIVESKATGHGLGAFSVDKLGQWMRRSSPTAPAHNIPSPVAQAGLQAEALRGLLNMASPPLLGKIAGLLQRKFGGFPITVRVALSNEARLVGPGAKAQPNVMKADAIAESVRAEIRGHQRYAGVIGLLRSGGTDKGSYSLSDQELGRIRAYLLARDVGAPPPARAVPPPAAASSPRAERPEALACRHCRSIRVGIVYRRDFCLHCEECGKYTPLDRACTRCGKPATIRKSGLCYARVCDKDGGCAADVVFWVEGRGQ